MCALIRIVKAVDNNRNGVTSRMKCECNLLETDVAEFIDDVNLNVLNVEKMSSHVKQCLALLLDYAPDSADVIADDDLKANWTQLTAFAKCHEDTAFRWLLGTQGSPVPVPGVARIRHQAKGRYGDAGAIRGAVRRLQERLRHPD